jgi:hypothetical protein
MSIIVPMKLVTSDEPQCAKFNSSIRANCNSVWTSEATYVINLRTVRQWEWLFVNGCILYNNKCNIVIWGDVNVNNLMDNNRRNQLDAVLHSYILTGIVEFPNRFGLNSQTAIDNVFIDISTIGNYELYPLINGRPDHDAQMLILNKGQKKERNVILTLKGKSISIPLQILNLN